MRHTQSISDVDITVNHVGTGLKTSQFICRNGEWVIAFAAAKMAILFTYPHHTRELSDYERFIIGQFVAFINSTQHGQSSCSTKQSVFELPGPMISSPIMLLSAHVHWDPLSNHHVPTHQTPTLRSANAGMLDNAVPNCASLHMYASSVARGIK